MLENSNQCGEDCGDTKLTRTPHHIDTPRHVDTASSTEVRPSMPDPDDATVEFKGFDKQIKAPYVIYADFECITEPICKAAKKSSSSYTDAYQSHTPCGFCYHVVSSDPSQTFEPEIYRGEDTISEFI